MTTKQKAGGTNGMPITSPKQQARQVLLSDLMIANYGADEHDHPMVKRAYAVLAGLIESKLKEIEK